MSSYRSETQSSRHEITMILVAIKVIILFLLVNTGCTSSPSLKDYPERRIDQPYTLPKGMTKATGLFNISYTKSIGYYDFNSRVPMNIYWENAISDDFSILWFVLPLGIRYQISRTQNHTFGFEFYTHLGPPEDPYLSPYLTLTDRYRLSENVELESNLGVQGIVLFKQSAFHRNYTMDFGPRFQISNRISSRVWLAYVLALVAYPNEDRVVNFPFGLSVEYSFTKQFNFDLNYTNTNLGNRIDGLSGPTFSGVMRYLW